MGGDGSYLSCPLCRSGSDGGLETEGTEDTSQEWNGAGVWGDWNSKGKAQDGRTHTHTRARAKGGRNAREPHGAQSLSYTFVRVSLSALCDEHTGDKTGSHAPQEGRFSNVLIVNWNMHRGS